MLFKGKGKKLQKKAYKTLNRNGPIKPHLNNKTNIDTHRYQWKLKNVTDGCRFSAESIFESLKFKHRKFSDARTIKNDQNMNYKCNDDVWRENFIVGRLFFEIFADWMEK
jgi:hypothetical protein